MKKILSLIAAALASTALLSCSRPTGEPEKDAESFKDIIQKMNELSLELEKKKVDYNEYYIDHYDIKIYELKDSLISDITKEYEHYDKRIAELNYQIQEREDELLETKDDNVIYTNDDE